MEIITKHYVEFLYAGSYYVDNMEVENRNPLQIQPHKDLAGFIFFDIDEVIDDGRVLMRGQNYNLQLLLFLREKIKG